MATKKGPTGSGFNDEEHTPVGSDVLSNILFRVGATHNAVKDLRENVHEMQADVKELRRETISRDECETKHGSVSAELDALDGNVGRMQQDLGAVKTDIGTVATKMGEVATSVKRLDGKNRTPLPVWLGCIVSLLGLLGTGVWGLIKLGRYLDRIDRTIAVTATANDEVRDELKQLSGNPPRVIYIKVPTAPDAGRAVATPRRPKPSR